MEIGGDFEMPMYNTPYRNEKRSDTAEGRQGIRLNVVANTGAGSVLVPYQRGIIMHNATHAIFREVIMWLRITCATQMIFVGRGTRYIRVLWMLVRNVAHFTFPTRKDASCVLGADADTSSEMIDGNIYIYICISGVWAILFSRSLLRSRAIPTYKMERDHHIVDN